MALPDFEVLAHIQNRGDLRGGPGVFVGTRGHDLRMEGFSITFRTPVDGLGLRYFAHVAYSGTDHLLVVMVEGRDRSHLDSITPTIDELLRTVTIPAGPAAS
jgi:hypothetical protein